MVTRIEMLSIEQAKTAARECGIRESMAGLNVYRTLLRHPQLASAVNHLLTTLLFTGNKLDVRLRELLIMRIGWTTGAKYEWTQHWHFAERVGLPPEDVIAVRDWRSSTRLSATDRAVLAAVDDTLEQGKISDSVWAECVQHIGSPEQLLEMVIAIGNWNMFSQLLRSIGIPLEEGVMDWPPDGRIPEGGDA
ncbi:MAG: carboxymuconolactone decarboxylase family protein [Reyranella sp.]|jgi:alkylhydroperoxidase family enzyme|uniref:carboxymuconolactone decarboxylase family protein n=1 Tax=Reyranella sp. TaxID=1929291 RepID=UPI0025DB501E|nr:carboxymuconolactone decarboxylase family protein [Reyranella sp.]MBR2813032.1 carboxymuconolactone decarboxylase family protein [Reyranella sp.]